jgi:hypothetical protein
MGHSKEDKVFLDPIGKVSVLSAPSETSIQSIPSKKPTITPTTNLPPGGSMNPLLFKHPRRIP